MRPIASLSLLTLATAAALAPAAVADTSAAATAPVVAASQAPTTTSAVYCVYLGPAGVGTTVLYEGGRYCVPGP